MPALLPFLAPAGLAAVSIEALQSSRRRAVFKRQAARFRTLTSTLEALASDGGATTTYRQSARPEALANAPPEVVALCTESERALLLRTTVRAGRPWRPRRSFEGVALVAIAASGPTLVANASREGNETRVAELASQLSATATRALSCPMESESWTWEKGRPESLGVEPFSP
jgi:hypothetical protein